MRILVPLDGSALAECALPHAAALAAAISAEVVLVRAVSTPPASCGDGSATTEEERYLQHAGRMLAGPEIRVQTAVRCGKPAEAILRTVSQERADLVVMATHARSGVGRWLSGSVAEAVLNDSPVPVLLVRAWEPERVQPRLQSHSTVLVPLDGSAFAEQALPVAGRLASILDGELVLLQAVWTPDSVFRAPLLSATWPLTSEAEDDDGPSGYLGLLEDEARKYLTGVAGRFAPQLRATWDVRVGSTPASAIVDGCRGHAAALVVMCTHGRTGVQRLAFGSVAAEVLRRGCTPLLLVPPSAMESTPNTCQQRSRTEMEADTVQEIKSVPAQRPIVDLSTMLMPSAVSDPLTPQGSPFERLVDTVEAHIRAEDDTLVDYRRLANMAMDPVVSLLMSMVVQDEERHHELLRRIAATLRDSLEWTHSPQALPTAHAATGGRAADAIAIVRECIRHEREGARHMRGLARDALRDDSGLNSMLVGTIAMDSEKHERILRYVLQRLKGDAREATEARPLASRKS